jgi:Cu(I)/Ag(I) efflux system membrane fusion protein
VSRQHPVKEVRLYGSILADERLVRSQASHVSGRIEKLLVNFKGETVRAGQAIATLYSPELLNAQQELLEAATFSDSRELLTAAREKLRLLKLTDSQIAAIEQAGKPSPLIDIVANTEGIITSKKVEQGDYVSQGSILFELSDLSSVWAMFDAYEADLPYLKTGDKVVYTLAALPGKSYEGRISFIDPSLDNTTRTAKVRVETANPALLLKPGMYANGVVQAALKQSGGSIVVPRTAVLWTGKRSLVYVRQGGEENPVFRMREIDLGTALGEAYVVLSGLSEGEEIVTSGLFAVDASAQLEGKPSMMNKEEAPPADETHTTTFAVQGLCEMCKERIEAAAKAVKGVIFASWDMETKQLHLNFDSRQTSREAVALSVAHAGHDTDAYKAADETYDALPDCCKYRVNY